MNLSIQKNFNRYAVLLLSFLLFFLLGVGSAFADSQDTPVLARVEVKKMVDRIGLPVHANLQGADKVDYALVIATIAQLEKAGSTYIVLHETDKLAEDMKYLIALERIPGTRQIAARYMDVLHDDGRNIIVAATRAQSLRLTKLSFKIRRLNETPMILKSEIERSAALKALAVPVTYNANVEKMINMVNQNTVYTYGADITGDNPIVVGGATYQIYSRYTYGPDIDIATQYTYEFFQAKGLSVGYHQWYGGRNVVATKAGTTKPTEIVLVIAHLDSMPDYGYSPGADDNASGSVGVMVAAEIMRQFNFERTVRFVLFTGEEQWMLGSDAYAQDLYYSGENVVAVLNLDMIGWDSWGGPVLRLHTQTTSSSGYTADKAIADTFVDVVNTYGMTGVLTPIIEADGAPSDHAAFWWVGYPAIMAAEDDYDDFCANYHTPNDTVSTLNLPYWTNYIKAAVGTAAHLAYPEVVATEGPVSSFTHTNNQLTVNFVDTSTCTNCTIQSWSWDFGDGSFATLQNPVHTYAASGTYAVTLTVTSSTGVSAAHTANIVVGDQPLVYCDSAGSYQGYEWIADVTVGGFNNTSGPSPYTDFTALSANLTPGAAVNLSLTPGFSGSAYTEYWTVWIDYNRDGDFMDPGEEVFRDVGSTTVSGSFTVPATAVGSTRMRVSMDDTGYPAACGTLNYGEVEDYTVTFQ